MQTYVTHHGIGVYLAHVSARVFRLHVTDVEFPSVVTVMRHGQSWVECHHVSVNC